MFFDAVRNDHGLPFNPLKALIGPRPIGWITALSARGELNLAPYSFFNAVAERPFMVAFSSNGYKDTVAFIDETKEFVCNLATYDLREAMNRSSAFQPESSAADIDSRWIARWVPTTPFGNDVVPDVYR